MLGFGKLGENIISPNPKSLFLYAYKEPQISQVSFQALFKNFCKVSMEDL